MNLLELRAEGHSYHEIARLTGISRNTVRKYIRDGAIRETRGSRSTRGSKLDPYKETIDNFVRDVSILAKSAARSR